MAGGRWSRVDSLLDPKVSDTERAVARANMLLERYGVVSREAALAEAVPGGFGPIYKVLSAMEESGRVRRGYFIEGLSAAQFARPGIVDRLRDMRTENETLIGATVEDIQYLSVIDPANPWGVLLPWPESGSLGATTKIRRVAGAWLLLGAGKPLLYVSANGRQLISFPCNLTEADMKTPAFEAQAISQKAKKLLVANAQAVARSALRPPHSVENCKLVGTNP